MNYDDLSPGEKWEDRYDPREGDVADPTPPTAAPQPLTDEELAILVPWF